MFNFLKKLVPLSNQSETLVDIYNLELPSDSGITSEKDLILLKHFLNFRPNKGNLACNIKTYSDDAFVYIYCQTLVNEWTYLSSDMMEIPKILTIANGINDFLNLLDIEDDETMDSLKETYIIEKAIQFVNETKMDFQSMCTEKDKLYFEKYSDVNYFKIIWGTSDHMNFILRSLG